MMNDNADDGTLDSNEEPSLDQATMQGIRQSYASIGGYVPNEQQYTPIRNNSAAHGGFEPIQMQAEPQNGWELWSWKTFICIVFVITVIVLLALAVIDMYGNISNSSGCGHKNTNCCDISSQNSVHLRKCLQSSYMNCNEKHGIGHCDIYCGDHGQQCCYDENDKSYSCRQYSQASANSKRLVCVNRDDYHQCEHTV